MKNHHIQQTRQNVPMLELLGSFFIFGLSAVFIVAWFRTIREDLEFVIYFSDLVFNSYLDTINFALSMVTWFFFGFVLFEKLGSSFNSSVLPALKLITGTLFIDKGETEQERFEAQGDKQEPQQQGTTHLTEEQAMFNQEYQAWRDRIKADISKDSTSSTVTHLPVFLLHQGAEHLVTSRESFQDFYSRANLSRETFEEDRKLWGLLEWESRNRFAAFRTAMLDGREQFLHRSCKVRHS
ncbi:hypothetical protein KCV07_g8644, partial [Aureobasidium melanogenum]